MSLATATTTCQSTPPATSVCVAYLVSRFPKLTETFVLYEVLGMKDLGVDIELFPLRRERTNVMHAEAAAVVRAAHFTPLLLSWRIVWAHLFFLLTQPRNYLSTLATLLHANLGSRRYLFGALAYFPKSALLARAMQRRGVEHVHAHFASHPAAIAYIIHRLTGIPFSFTAHGSDLHRDRHMLREKVAAAKYVVTISQYNREVIRQHCGDDCLGKIRVIHCGVDIEKFQPTGCETEFDRGTGPFKVVCTGTLHEVKGQRYLLDAVCILREQYVKIECHLIGDGQDRQALRKQACELGVADQVIFHGRLPQHEVVEHLRAADVIAAPSVPTACGRREGIPVALMEAMSCGLPAGASDLSGIPELVEDDTTGLLTAPRDAGSIAGALARLYHDRELRRRLGMQARRKVEDEFNLAVNTRELAQCFQSGGEL